MRLVLPVFLHINQYAIYYSLSIPCIKEAQKCDKQLATTASQGLGISYDYTVHGYM
jgi:hypothetical protein